LKTTLQKSKSKLRFVFIHNLVGGADNNGIARGGIEAARFFEWGGLNSASEYGYKEGSIMNAPCYLSVTVEGNAAMVDYLQTSVDPENTNKKVLNSYLIGPFN
jgi:hypothetical protein